MKYSNDKEQQTGHVFLSIIVRVSCDMVSVSYTGLPRGGHDI